MVTGTTESNRELLELAAKAAGIEGTYESWCYLGFNEGIRQKGFESKAYRPWNPLTDDGDEARLEAALGLNVEWQTQHVIVGKTMLDTWQESYALHDGDKQAARRYAGVRAAASIGGKETL